MLLQRIYGFHVDHITFSDGLLQIVCDVPSKKLLENVPYDTHFLTLSALYICCVQPPVQLFNCLIIVFTDLLIRRLEGPLRH